MSQPQNEIRTKVQTIRVDRKCSQCEDGVMESLSMQTINATDPYMHRCNECGHPEHLSVVYPRIDYEEIKEDGEE